MMVNNLVGDDYYMVNDDFAKPWYNPFPLYGMSILPLDTIYLVSIIYLVLVRINMVNMVHILLIIVNKYGYYMVNDG